MMIKNERRELFILFLISFLLSIYLFFRTYTISLDGAFQYIPIAKDFASGFFRKALGHNQQPLYSLIVAFVSRWVPDFELAGKLVSSIFGILLVLPVYFLGKRIFDEKIVLLSSFFLVIHPYVRRVSADVLKESTFLFFLGTAVWFAWRTIQDQEKYSFLFIPIFSVLAYLVRPDGIEVFLVVFIYVLFVKKFSIPIRKREIVLLLTLSSCVLLLPYLLYLRELRGEWTFGKAKSILDMLGLGEHENGVPFADKILYSLKTLNLDILTVFHPVYIFLLIIGLLKSIFSRLRTGEGFLLSLCCSHYLVLFLMVLNTTEWSEKGAIKAVYLSGRHVLPLLLMCIYWVGQGFLTVYQWVSERVESRRLFLPLKLKGNPLIILGALLVLIMATVLPKTMKPQRYEHLSEKWAGIWVKDRSDKGAIVFTNLPRVAYYTNRKCEYVDPRKSTVNEIKALTAGQKASYLVVLEEDISGDPEKVKSLQETFNEVIRFGGKGKEKIIIYKGIH